MIATTTYSVILILYVITGNVTGSADDPLWIVAVNIKVRRVRLNHVREDASIRESNRKTFQVLIDEDTLFKY